jgi:sensor domain CHASE-containing protein
VVLATGAALLRSATVSPQLVPLLVAGGVAVVVGVSLWMELRRSAKA